MATQGTRLQSALVRPFILTGGRTATSREGLRWETLVEAAPQAGGQAAPQAAPLERTSEQTALLALAAQPVSVAELSASLRLPTQVVAIVVSDLLEAGAVRLHQTDPVEIELSAFTRMIERVRGL